MLGDGRAPRPTCEVHGEYRTRWPYKDAAGPCHYLSAKGGRLLGGDPGADARRAGSPPRSRDRSLPQDSNLDLQRGLGHSLRGSRARAAGVREAGQRSAGLRAGGPPGEERRESHRASVPLGLPGSRPRPRTPGRKGRGLGASERCSRGSATGLGSRLRRPGAGTRGQGGVAGPRPGAGALGPAGSEDMRACWAPRARHRGGRRLRRPSRSTGPARTPAGKWRSGPASSASQAVASRSLPAEASGPRAPPKNSSSPPAEIHAAAEQVRVARRGPNPGPPRPPLPPGRGGGGGGERRIKEGGRRRVGRDRRGRGGEGREQVGRRGGERKEEEGRGEGEEDWEGREGEGGRRRGEREEDGGQRPHPCLLPGP